MIKTGITITIRFPGEHVAVGIAADDVDAGQGEGRLLLVRHLQGQGTRATGVLHVWLTDCHRVHT